MFYALKQTAARSGRSRSASAARGRLVLVLLMCLLQPVASRGQSNDFNPYQAVLDRMPLAKAEKQIVAAYGPVIDRYSGNGQVNEGGPTLVLSANRPGGPAFFLFCEQKLSAFAGPITPATAAEILRPLIAERTDITVYPTDDGMFFEAMGQSLSITYMGVGTKSSSVFAAYPTSATRAYDITSHCKT
ncbi:MAG TPA: hypothetical protein VGB81_07215 [Devosia sp.]